MTERFILTSHGSLAAGMKSAIEMICGDDDRIESYDLDSYLEPSRILEAVEEEVTRQPENQFYIFTDLLGGSVHNCLLPLAMHENALLISGMHLGLVLSVMLDQENAAMIEKAEKAIRASVPFIQAFNRDLILEQTERTEKEENNDSVFES